MKVLNVAEKNDAAKNIAGLLSRGTSRMRNGLSVYNKIYEFKTNLWNQNCEMIMTSVSGHLLNHEFVGQYRYWESCHPLTLFDAPVAKTCSEKNFINIKKTLEREVKNCNALIIWTDCDREGENIGFEIIQVCQAIKPNIRIYRAKFSEITQASVNRALQNLAEPDKATSDAVDVRSELDLRIGAAFTRFQTMRLCKVFPRSLAGMMISYGSCQFPTLGFVVERFLAIERFTPEPYWKIKVMDVRDEISVEFRWARVRLFEKLPCEVFLDICLDHGMANVEKVTSKPKSKWRPLPLDTIELEKQGSRKLRLSAKETMKIAEKLYTQGFISYPRTETNIFPKEFDLVSLARQQVNNAAWGNFAQQLIEKGVNPRQGKKSDQAHPPIHPIKPAENLQGNEAKVYEFIVRHFLACLSENAVGQETIVEIDIGGEKFTATGLQIIEKNYLLVYIYERWSDKEIHVYQQGQFFEPTSIEMVEEQTSPPQLLTEADLITLMDKHGIGTDATHAEHIEKIKSRQYVGLMDDKHIMPGKLGIGLVMGYDKMGMQMSKPNLRADLEKDLKLICERQKNPKDVLQNQINNYRDVFKVALERANLIDTALADYLDERPTEAQQIEFTNPPEETGIFKCPKCGCNMVLRERRSGTGKYIGCAAYPTCNNAIWFPPTVEGVEVLNDVCPECTGNMRKLKFNLHRNAFPLFGSTYTTCIGGCDATFNETLKIKSETIRRSTRDDTGYNTISEGLRSTSISNPSQVRTTATQQSSAGRRRPAPSETANTSLGLVRPTNSIPSNAKKPKTTKTNVRRKNVEPDNTWISTSFHSAETEERPSVSRTSERNQTWGNIDDNADIMCNCHENAIQLTVRKDGPNQGRLFYKCAKPQGTGCNFFLWASDSPNSLQNNLNGTFNRTSIPSTSTSSSSARFDSNAPSSSNWGNSSTTGSSSNVMCTCNEPARLLTVHKEGPNKGRQFYGCPKGMNSTCKFFKWADDDDIQNQNQPINRWNNNTSAGPSRGRGRGTKPRATGTKRKCGVCGTVGHTRKTCPENAMD